MPNHVESKEVTVSVKIYERLLATYPTDFRREYGPAMKQLFRDQCRDAWSHAQGRGLVVLWLRVLPDWARTSLVQHLLNLHKRESMCMKIWHAFRADVRTRAAFTRVFAAVFLLCVVTSTLLTIWLPKQYSSMAQIEVQKDVPEAAVAEPHQQMLNTDPYFLASQFKIIESYRILTNVIVNLHLDEKLARQNGAATRWTIDETFAYLVHQLSVEQMRMTSLIEISVRNQSPELAASIANAVAASYKQFRIEQWKDSHWRGIKALEDKQASMTNDLLAAQKGQPNPGVVTVSNPARPDFVPTNRRVFLMWMILGGTLLAAVAGGGSAWRARQSNAR
jgi:capsular polysaccharide biosynthesis protein